MDIYLKTFLVFIHFALASYCLISVVSMDWKILQNYSNPISQELHREIIKTKTTIPLALTALWITGLLIVLYGAYSNPNYLDNQKLWFKFFVVAVLTLNGLLVHKIGRIVKPGLVLASMDDKTAFLLNLVGVVSSVSWIWACFIGTARAWNGTMSFSTIMNFYITSLVVVMSLALIFHNRWKRKATQVI